ncbi:MAG: PAS domain-containing protein [Chloroflexi bacterium]|nr:PAS domain-containing protein [Chloroflexota bacterium]
MDAKEIAAQLARELHYLDMPIGVYVVATDGQFIACNRLVRDMLALPLDGDVHASLAQFYADANTRGELLRKAAEAEARGSFLQKEIIHLRVAARDLYVEDYCKPLRDPATRAIVGYIGCLVDITIEYEAQKREGQLQNKVEELTFDIGRILHANTSTLLMAQQTLDSVAEALSQRALKEVIGTPLEDLDEQLIKEAEQLAGTLDKLIQGSDASRRAQALPEAKWDALATKIAPLRQVREMVPGFEMRVPALRTAAHQVTVTCHAMTTGALPRELVKEVLRAAAQLENTACLADVLMSRMAIVQMDATLRSLRDFVTADIRTHEPKKRLSVKLLVEQTITQMAEFARTSRVDIHRKERDFDVGVEGIERDVTRALANLLHNAIKYSWRRDRYKSPWVTVRAFARDGIACIEFENWGVPIAQEEIDNGLIFQLGYRGKWSKDRGRLGTGIGLTDAKRTAEANRGSLHVASRPANPGWVRPDDRDYYNQPFITTVTFCLPESAEVRR